MADKAQSVEQFAKDFEKAKELATRAHNKQKYGGYPYTYHLSKVEQALRRFGYDPSESADDKHESLSWDLITAAWPHDTIEDTRKSYNDVRNETESQLLADIVYAVSNEKGKTRAQRANKDYYIGIVEQYGAIFVKLCDRIANLIHGKENNSNMFAMYRKEHPHFIDSDLPTEELKKQYEPMVLEIETLLGI